MEISFVIFTSLLIILYVTYFVTRKKNAIGDQGINKFKKIHFALLIFLSTLFILNLFGIYLKWFWPAKIAMWIFYFTGLLVAIFAKNRYKRDLGKYYFNLIFYFPFGLLVAWIVPMLGAFTMYNFMLLFTVDKPEIVYNDSNYKLEFSNSFLKPLGDPILYTKNSIFEIMHGEVELSKIGSFKSIKINELNDNKLQFSYKNEQGISVEKIVQLKN